MADLSKLVDELSSLTLLEAADLAKLLEEKWQPSKARQPKVSIADIKIDLPGWPDEVVAEWLHWFANDICWPPPEPLGDRWSGILGGRPLSWWKNVSWQKETVKCALEKLSEKSRQIVNSTIKEVGKAPADDLTRKRFKRAMDYILDAGAVPGSIVAMRVPSGLEILDGSHRMSAFCGAQLMTDAAYERLGKKRPALDHEVWIGIHSDGELPLT